MAARRRRPVAPPAAPPQAPLVLKYPDILALVDAATTRAVHPENVDMARRVAEGSYDERESFTGLKRAQPLETTLDFWLSGWGDGVDKMRSTMERIAPPRVASVRRRGRWADAGDDLSLDRLYAGRLEVAWRTTHRTSVLSPSRVRLVVDLGATANVSADEFFWRGAATCSFAEALIGAGYSVEIWCVVSTRAVDCGTLNAHSAVCVKAFASPLNMSALTAATAHPAFFRCALLGARVAAIPAPADRSGGYRLAADLRLLGLESDASVRSILVPGTIDSADAANVWIKTQAQDLPGAA